MPEKLKRGMKYVGVKPFNTPLEMQVHAWRHIGCCDAESAAFNTPLEMQKLRINPEGLFDSDFQYSIGDARAWRVHDLRHAFILAFNTPLEMPAM